MREFFAPITPSDIESLRSAFSYDQNTGVFAWKINKGQRGRIGLHAGTETAKGYRSLRYDRRIFKAHRVAWAFVHGNVPDLEIDHIDGNPRNNAISNLRLATKSENAQNIYRPRGNNAIGFLGVTKTGNRYCAQIGHAGKHEFIGYFATPEDAHMAYVARKREIHPRCEI